VTSSEERFEQLAKTNPLFGPRRLKLGTFCPNVSNGATMSTMDGVFDLTWENSRKLARMADEMAFEAIVPIGRWRGSGGSTDFNGNSFEPLTFSAAMAVCTSNPSVFATVHVPSLHPVTATKQATTVDHISGGRFTLNIVTGWNKTEMDMFGSAMKGHDERYQVADEWISLMKLLWTSVEPVKFEGKYFNVRDAYLRPQPIQPYPALMSAGASPAGRRFAAKHCDIAFTALTERNNSAVIRKQLDSFRQIAREEFGRGIKTWINAYVFMGDTEADAQKKFDYCIGEKGDHVGVENLFRELGLNSLTHTEEARHKLKQDFMAGWAGFRLLGTKEKIIDDMRMLVDAGVDGMLLSWPAYIDDMKQFQEEVYPLLQQAGLR
jgi:alkanesulfonate monooxygenase SsuD/methylene tetrahydromethanopterin reductase-like flavin-dependent oxidoreductase (luciferase family)